MRSSARIGLYALLCLGTVQELYVTGFQTVRLLLGFLPRK
jgi:hypothetical protein